MTWATVDQVREAWADAPLSDDLLERWLATAHAQCLAYAPRLPDDAEPPANYVEAEIEQVQEIGQSHERDGDVLGYGEGYAVRVRPLTDSVKAKLRPRRAVPRVR